MCLVIFQNKVGNINVDFPLKVQNGTKTSTYKSVRCR